MVVLRTAAILEPIQKGVEMTLKLLPVKFRIMDVLVSLSATELL